MDVNPNIVVLQNVSFTSAEMQDVLAVVGRDLFTDDFRKTLVQFEQAKNFGSLIVPKLRDPAETLRVVMARDFDGDLLLKEVRERVIAVLVMAEALSSKYTGCYLFCPRVRSLACQRFRRNSDATKRCFEGVSGLSERQADPLGKVCEHGSRPNACTRLLIRNRSRQANLSAWLWCDWRSRR